MKPINSLVPIILGLFFTTQGFAQSLYSSPEPSESAPLLVNKNDALNEASDVSGECGYSRAYISSKDLQSLLSTSGAVGIRLYNGKETSEQGNCDVVAVAVDANGKEIGPAVGNKYLQAQSYDENNSCTARKVSKSTATTCVSNVANSSLKGQKVFFSKAMLDERLKTSGATGITILPGQIDDESTMMVMAAKLESSKITELEDDYLKSRLPCPTDCGDSGNYLVAPK